MNTENSQNEAPTTQPEQSSQPSVEPPSSPSTASPPAAPQPPTPPEVTGKAPKLQPVEIPLPLMLSMQGSQPKVLEALGVATEGRALTHEGAPHFEALMATLQLAGHRVDDLDLADDEQVRLEVLFDKTVSVVKVIPITVALPVGIKSVEELEAFETAQAKL